MEQTVGLNRITGNKHPNTLDKYYTSKDTVNTIMTYISHIKSNDLVIEPSAGNGAFINPIKEKYKYYMFIDIYPENDDIIKEDFLEFDFDKLPNKNIHFIGNPPFGKQSKTAIKFIKKCCKIAKSISFILPKSFKKESRHVHFPLNYHLHKQVDLDRDCFLVNDKPYDVPCVFQIWIKKDYNRSVPNKPTPIHFKFVKKDENPDISFRRVGGTAGTIDKDYKSKSVQSHYFIKFLIPFNDIIFNKLKDVHFEESNDTVAAKSISKSELINAYNSKLNN